MRFVASSMGICVERDGLVGVEEKKWLAILPELKKQVSVGEIVVMDEVLLYLIGGDAECVAMPDLQGLVWMSKWCWKIINHILDSARKI